MNSKKYHFMAGVSIFAIFLISIVALVLTLNDVEVRVEESSIEDEAKGIARGLGELAAEFKKGMDGDTEE